MKKILLSLVIFSLIFAFAGIGLAQELEKIPSPDQIKNFQEIRKEGNSLFGIRKAPKQEKENKPEKPKFDQTNAILGASSSLEKISNPGEISLFEKIKKIGTALWGIRKNNANKPNENNKKPLYVRPESVQCVKDAIDKKDYSWKNAISLNSQNILDYVTSRNTCQKAALDKTSAKEQIEANKLCVETYKKSFKENREILKKSRDEAWKIYKDDLKKCSQLQKASNATTTIIVTEPEQAEEIMIDDGEEGI